MYIIRLDKLIADKTGESRGSVREMLKNGLVSVNGATACDGSLRLDADESRVSVRGKPLDLRRFRYILMNKPKGTVCATEDALHPTVVSLVPDEFFCRGLAPVGRLDIDTTGLLLITNDGEFAHKVISPKKNVPKYYIADLANPIDSSYEQAFARGIEFRGEKYRPAKIKALEASGKRVLVEITEGRFHQVKYMFEALSNRVTDLHREQIGELFLPPDSASGDCLDIMNKEAYQMLKSPTFGSVFDRIFVNFSSL